MTRGTYLRIFVVMLAVLVWSALAFASAPSAQKKSSSGRVNASAPAKKKNVASNSRKKKKNTRRRYRQVYYPTSSFDENNTAGDITEGEDPVVRAAAEDALGILNGTLVAIDADSGRILAMVNQKLALSEGAKPCSTFKTAVGLAALSEGIIGRETEIRTGRRATMNLTEALAKSNNPFFEVLGRRLGFERVAYYARQLGIGELAGFDIEGEHLGAFPTREISKAEGGVGKMCSFGQGIQITPLQLGAMMAALANGGSLYYLQHPRSREEVQTFLPVLKRNLRIHEYIPDVTEGLVGAVEYGTARSVRYSFVEEPVSGKTGSCSQDGTRFGWFASFAQTPKGRIATVVFLRGGKIVVGPKAAEVTGRFYRHLYDNDAFARSAPVPGALVSASGAGH